MSRVVEEIPSSRHEVYENCKKFTEEILDITRTFVRKNIMALRKGKQWKDLSSKMKNELLSGSGVIFDDMEENEGMSSITKTKK